MRKLHISRSFCLFSKIIVLSQFCVNQDMLKRHFRHFSVWVLFSNQSVSLCRKKIVWNRANNPRCFTTLYDVTLLSVPSNEFKFCAAPQKIKEENKNVLTLQTKSDIFSRNICKVRHLSKYGPIQMSLHFRKHEIRLSLFCFLFLWWLFLVSSFFLVNKMKRFRFLMLKLLNTICYFLIRWI